MTRTQLYPSVVSTLALLVALVGGGVAVAGALPKNSVSSKQIKNSTIKPKDLKPGGLTGAQVADGSLTGADVNAATLGKVPRAADVDSLRVVRTDIAPGTTAVVLTDGPFTMTAFCWLLDPTLAQLTFSSTVDHAFVQSDTVTQQDVTLGSSPVIFSVAGSNGRTSISAMTRNGSDTLQGVALMTATLFNKPCHVEIVTFG